MSNFNGTFDRSFRIESVGHFGFGSLVFDLFRGMDSTCWKMELLFVFRIFLRIWTRVGYKRSKWRSTLSWMLVSSKFQRSLQLDCAIPFPMASLATATARYSIRANNDYLGKESFETRDV